MEIFVNFYKKQLFLKRTILFLFLLVFLQCEAKQHVISLGPNCSPAMSLNYHKIRKEAYPFDWVVCSFDAMFKLLQTDFENYLLPENLILKPQAPFFVFDIYTNVQYNHDFPISNVDDKLYEDQWKDAGGVGVVVSNFLDYLPDVYAKYLRRINRLGEVLNSTEDNVIFVHYGITKNQAVLLRDFFESHYPHLNFIILAVNGAQEFSKNKWSENKIHDYCITDMGWDMSAPGYYNVFKDIGLISKEE